MNELACFTGGGGSIYAGKLLGWTPVGAIESEERRRRILLARQADGTFPVFPVWDDVKTFRGEEWQGLVDIVTGGFPCEDLSVAGKQRGIDGLRTGLWREMLRVVREVRPRRVFMENVSQLVQSGGIAAVLGSLAEIGYDAEWICLSAKQCGANHIRDRAWILAYAHGHGARGNLAGLEKTPSPEPASRPQLVGRLANDRWSPWQSEPEICRVDDGLAGWRDRLEALGQGWVPLVAAAAYRILERRACGD